MRTLHKSLIALALAGVLALPLLRLDADASAPATAPEAPPAVVSVAPAISTDFAPRHWAPGSIIKALMLMQFQLCEGILCVPSPPNRLERIRQS